MAQVCVFGHRSPCFWQPPPPRGNDRSSRRREKQSCGPWEYVVRKVSCRVSLSMPYAISHVVCQYFSGEPCNDHHVRRTSPRTKSQGPNFIKSDIPREFHILPRVVTTCSNCGIEIRAALHQPVYTRRSSTGCRRATVSSHIPHSKSDRERRQPLSYKTGH